MNSHNTCELLRNIQKLLRIVPLRAIKPIQKFFI